MAKMFYTINETAETLGITDDQVRNLANEGKLQQFRDRDQLMFKRDQVDAMAANAASFTDDEDERSTGLLTMTDDGTATLAEGDVSAEDVQLSPDNAPSTGSGLLDLDLSADLDAPSAEPKDPRQETGISIFDADELEQAADPMAATQVSESIDDEVEQSQQISSYILGTSIYGTANVKGRITSAFVPDAEEFERRMSAVDQARSVVSEINSRPTYQRDRSERGYDAP